MLGVISSSRECSEFLDVRLYRVDSRSWRSKGLIIVRYLFAFEERESLASFQESTKIGGEILEMRTLEPSSEPDPLVKMQTIKRKGAP